MLHPCSFLFVPGDSQRKHGQGRGHRRARPDARPRGLRRGAEPRLPHARLSASTSIRTATASGSRCGSASTRSTRTRPSTTWRPSWAARPTACCCPSARAATRSLCLDHFLTALERREGVEAESIRIMAVATETPAAMFELGSYKNASRRLHGLTWGAEDLATAVGATTNREDDGAYAFTYQLARSLCLLGAKAAGVQAFDTMNANFRDREALATEVRRARLDGFSGKFAIHPDQVEVINAGFRPDEREIAHARAIVAAFRSADGVGHRAGERHDGGQAAPDPGAADSRGRRRARHP